MKKGCPKCKKDTIELFKAHQVYKCTNCGREISLKLDEEVDIPIKSFTSSIKSHNELPTILSSK